MRTSESERKQAYLLIAPAVLLLVAVAPGPLVAAVVLSFFRYVVVFGERSFIGIDNYAFLLGDPRFRSALAHTAYFTVVAVTLELALAIPVALLLNGALRGRGLVRALVLLPWTIPTAVSARLFALLFSTDAGAVNQLLGLRVNWLGSPTLAMHVAIGMDAWKTTPFVALLVLAGLQGIPEDLFKAARIDGASPARIFRSITLPLLRPAIALAVLFRALDAFRVFDAIYVLTEGGPANTTETLSIYAYKTLMRSGDFGYGSTIAVVTFVGVVLLAAALLALGRDRGAE